MASLALLLDNLADQGTISASSELSGMPVSNLIDSPHVWQDQWRGAGDSADVTWDYGSDVMGDTVALLGQVLSENATIRLRLSTSSGGPTLGDVLDATYAADGTRLDPDIGALVALLPTAEAFRYARFDIVDSGASFLCAGRVVIGAREQLAYTFAPGSGLGWDDPSIVAESKGGQTQSWRKRFRRVETLDVQWITAEQRWGVIERLMRVNGRTRDVLVILDPEAAYLPRETIWGLMAESSPVAWTQIADIYSRQFQIKERL